MNTHGYTYRHTLELTHLLADNNCIVERAIATQQMFLAKPIHAARFDDRLHFLHVLDALIQTAPQRTQLLASYTTLGRRTLRSLRTDINQDHILLDFMNAEEVTFPDGEDFTQP